MDNTVSRTQRNSAPVHDEIRQVMMSLNVHRFRICGSMAERLHHQVGRKAQASQILQFVPSHRAGGILGTNGGHSRFAIGSGANTLDTTGLTNHLLRQGIAFARIVGLLGTTESVRRFQPQRTTRPFRQAATNDQRNPATGLNFVEKNISLQVEFGDYFAGIVSLHLAFIGEDIDHVTHVHVADIAFKRQGTRIFHRIEEDRSNLAANTNATGSLVRNVRDVVTHVPQHRVGRRFPRRARSNHVTNVSDRMTLRFQFVDLLFGIGDSFTGHFEHCLGVQRDIRT